MQGEVQLKLCGLRRRQDIIYVNELLPDFVGFVFAESRRRVTREEAAELTGHLHPAIKRVGVFVDQPVDFVAELFAAGVIQYAQLHGAEDEAYISALRSRTGQLGPEAGIIKAIKVRSRDSLTGAGAIDCEYLLLDAWPENGQAEGGNGKTFDWDLIQSLEKPFFLAGGINHDNVRTAMEKVRPFGIDVSSCLETEGYKDYKKMKAFVNLVRGK